MQLGIETRGVDPLLATVSLPLSGVYYPAGFRLDLSTNSRDVLAAAGECWSECRPEFERPPIEIRVIVQPRGALSPKPSFRCQRHLYSVVGDADNFAVADLDSLFASVFVSSQTAADHAWLRWFFVESLAYTLLAQRYIVPVHAACVAQKGRGILLCGPSGAGKSTLSFACVRAGWTFVTDDCAWLLPGSQCREAIGRPREARFRPDSVSLFPELARFAERARPNGKIALEVPLSEFPRIETARRCALHCLVFLDRRADAPASISPMPAGEALHLLSQDLGFFSQEVEELHETTFQTLTLLPAYRLRYGNLEEGCRLLASLTNEPDA